MNNQIPISKINSEAPVIAKGEIRVNATPDIVWEIMTNIERWPEWNPDVESARVNDELVPGATFQWKAGPGTITSTLQQVERPAVLAWTGKTMGINAVHVWMIELQESGTLVRTEESWDGLLARLFSGTMQKTLDQSIHQGLRYLKTEAERRTEQGRN
jgi:carbon monoxide dehydrogenase subunit G